MKPLYRSIAAAAAIAATALAVHAGQARIQPPSIAQAERPAADPRPGVPVPGPGIPVPIPGPIRPPPQPGVPPPHPDDVGDVHSFGRPLRWLGVTQMNVSLGESCPGPLDRAVCQEILPGQTSLSFAFDDVARIRLPANATHSMLCHWFSPYGLVEFTNPNPPGAATVIGSLGWNPWLIIENPVLDDPSLIDVHTGMPFNGRFRTGVSNNEMFQVPVPAGVTLPQIHRDTATCIGGFVSHQVLSSHGLSEALIAEFFRHPITIRMGISGSATYLSEMNVTFGLRVIGD